MASRGTLAPETRRHREESHDRCRTRPRARHRHTAGQTRPGRDLRRVHQVDLPGVQGRRRRTGEHPRRQGVPAQTLPRTRRVRGAGLRRRADVPGLGAVQQARHHPADLPDRGQGRLPLGLRAVPGAQAARLPRHHRGQHRLQPGLPDLLRRLRSPAGRLLNHPGAVRADARRVRGQRGRGRGGHVLRRGADHPQADPGVRRRRPGPPDQGGQPQHQRHPPGLRQVARCRTWRAQPAGPGGEHLPAVRRLRGAHAPRDPRPGPAGGQAEGPGQLRRGGAHRHAGRRRGARPQRPRTRRHHRTVFRSSRSPTRAGTSSSTR